MRGILQQIAEELRHVYVLGYYPSRPLDEGGYRRLRVRVNEPGAKVRARSGYQARAVANGNPFNQ
jgi:Ca-activated chloride channel homolog